MRWLPAAAIPQLRGWRALLALALLVSLFAGLLFVRPWRQAESWLGAVIPLHSAAGTAVAPGFTLPLFDGGSFRLADHRGQVVVLNFWASWCVPCRSEAPRLEAAAQTYQPQNVVVVGVNTQDRESDARAFIREHGLSYPNGSDSDAAITVDYDVTGLPTTVVVDRQGRIRQVWRGEIGAAQLTGFIEEALR